MTAKGDEKKIAEVIEKNLNYNGFQKRIGFYISNKTRIRRFYNEPELDMLLTNCRLENGWPTNINIEIYDKKSDIGLGEIRKKYENHPDSTLVFCLKGRPQNNNKYNGLVYSAFTIRNYEEKNFSYTNKKDCDFFYKNYLVNHINNTAGMGDEKRGINNITCLTDIIRTNIKNNAKKRALFFLGDLLAGQKFKGYRLRHCFFENSLSLLRLIFVDDKMKTMNDKMKRKYLNVFIENPTMSKKERDLLLVARRKKDYILNDDFYVLLKKTENVDNISFKNYIHGYIKVSTTKNHAAKGMSITEIKKIK